VNETGALLCWEATEPRSWNPVLARLLREQGYAVTEVNELAQLWDLDLARFDICLPRFRVGCAAMVCLDAMLTRASMPMLNSRTTRLTCENKALAHVAFADAGIPQPESLVVSCEGQLDRPVRWDGETLIKPLHGNRSAGIEIFASPAAAIARAHERAEDLLVQEMIWPARCWRLIVGRNSGITDPYWRRPPGDGERILSISTGAAIARDPMPDAVGAVALEMLEAVEGDLLAVDVLERDGQAWALEINHNFDAHGGDQEALAAFVTEIEAMVAPNERPAAAAAQPAA
jgi:glutathione synthase/RimK-type ligase-like ATP-grasp enzyme